MDSLVMKYRFNYKKKSDVVDFSRNSLKMVEIWAVVDVVRMDKLL